MRARRLRSVRKWRSAASSRRLRFRGGRRTFLQGGKRGLQDLSGLRARRLRGLLRGGLMPRLFMRTLAVAARPHISNRADGRADGNQTENSSRHESSGRVCREKPRCASISAPADGPHGGERRRPRPETRRAEHVDQSARMPGRRRPCRDRGVAISPVTTARRWRRVPWLQNSRRRRRGAGQRVRSYRRSLFV